MSNKYLEAALEYARQGFSVFPCRARSKTPANSHGCKEASKDEAKIREWWSNTPNANVAIATGEVSDGLVVIDLDIKGDKRAAIYLKEWQELHGDFPDTWITLTGGGGHHILYKTDQPLRNSTNAELCIDIRANGGYIIAPPSLHPTGAKYRWYTQNGDVAKADENVLNFIASVSKRQKEKKKQNFMLKNQIVEGERDDTLFKYAASLQARGFSDEAILQSLTETNEERCTTPLPQADIERIWHSVIEHYEKGVRADTMQKGRNGVYTDCLTNLQAILNQDDEFAGHFYHDVRAFRNKVILPLPWDDRAGERLLSDIDYTQFQKYLENYETPEQVMHIKASDRNIRAAFENVCDDHRRNPLQEWLESLEWDGVPRIERLATDFLGVEFSNYSANVMRLLMYGAVKRAYHPGTKFDYVPVLVGTQGVGKSTFVQRLCPNPEWYLDNLTTMEGDDAVEKLENKWIVEVAELANLRRDKLETVKAFITQTQDTYRGKYKRNAEDRPRGAVFIGTTNSTTFLTDPSGNRRWLPLKCGKVAPTRSLFKKSETEEWFKMAWAEAVHNCKANEISLILDAENEGEAIKVRDDFTTDDPRAGLIGEYLDQKLAQHEAMKLETLNPPECRVCPKELGQMLEEKHNYPHIKYYGDLVELVQAIGGWEYHGGERRKCGEFGQQRYFTPIPPTPKEEPASLVQEPEEWDFDVMTGEPI